MQQLAIVRLGARLTVVVACASMVLSCGDQQLDSRSKSTAVGGPTTSDSSAATTQDVRSTPESTDIAGSVASALVALDMPAEASAAVDLLATISGNQFLSECVVAAGFKERQIPEASLTAGEFSAGGVSIAWHLPVEAAGAERGVGVHPLPNQPSGARLVYTDPADPNVSDNSDEANAYNNAFQRCTGQRVSPEYVDWNLVETIQAEAATIASKSRDVPAFAAIRAEYESCLEATGMTLFTDPSEVLDVAMNLAGDDAAVTERDMAVADATCRAPLYGTFIQLSAAEWSSWLGRRQPDIDKIAAHWIEIIKQSGIRDLPRVEGP